MFRIKRRFAEEGLAGVLQDRVQANRYRKLDDRGEAHLIALACSRRRQGEHWSACWRGRWWSWGAGAVLVPRDGAAAPEKNLPSRAEAGVVHSPGKRRLRAHMEDVLDLYEPLTQSGWSALTRPPPNCWPRPGRRCRLRGQPLRQDSEYRREGTRFLTCEPLAGWRQVAVTERRTMQDFAQQMRWLVDEAYPAVAVVRVVLDNLNTHRVASLYETFPAQEARRIAKRLEFHHAADMRKSSSAYCPAPA